MKCLKPMFKEVLGPEFILDDAIPEQSLSSQMRLFSNKLLSSVKLVAPIASVLGMEGELDLGPEEFP